MIAGTAFIIGAIFQASAKNTIALLFIGRVFWGIGVGFGDHCAFIYTVCAEELADVLGLACGTRQHPSTPVLMPGSPSQGGAGLSTAAGSRPAVA